MRVTEYIDKEMDRILTHRTRERQNEEFKNLKPSIPLEPIRMTLTTAVFKYTATRPNIILKRIIMNPATDLKEDVMSSSLDSPYVCRTLKTFRTYRWVEKAETQETIIWIFFEYLNVKISQKNISGDEDQIRPIIRDALYGLDYLHSKGIAHLDMKIGNIMGKQVKDSLTYKLIDFGYSQKMPHEGFKIIPKKNYGTYPYKPPEVVFKNEHGVKSDIWSLGAIAWFLSLQYTPFYFDAYDKDLVSYRKFLKKRGVNDFEDVGNHTFTFKSTTSVSLKHFVKLAMQVEPEDRPTARELLNHPFITGEDVELDYDSSGDRIEDSEYESH